MTIKEMKDRKRELGLTNKMIAERSGVPLSTVQKVFSGATSYPREETIRALENILKPRFFYDMPAPVGYSSLAVRDALPAYNEKRLYTLEDYLALPDDLRVELIDGVFYDMAAPHGVHQTIIGYLHMQFRLFVKENKGPCFPFLSPFDVQLDCDDKTVVQPDVMIICDREKLRNGRIFGAPDLVVEVLSPSTRKKDMQLKMFKYGNAGVREYWLVDPEKRVVIQYDLVENTPPAIYGTDAEVPVLIWDGKCRISVGEMFEEIAFLFDE